MKTTVRRVIRAAAVARARQTEAEEEDEHDAADDTKHYRRRQARALPRRQPVAHLSQRQQRHGRGRPVRATAEAEGHGRVEGLFCFGGRRGSRGNGLQQPKRRGLGRSALLPTQGPCGGVVVGKGPRREHPLGQGSLWSAANAAPAEGRRGGRGRVLGPGGGVRRCSLKCGGTVRGRPRARRRHCSGGFSGRCGAAAGRGCRRGRGSRRVLRSGPGNGWNGLGALDLQQRAPACVLAELLGGRGGRRSGGPAALGPVTASPIRAQRFRGGCCSERQKQGQRYELGMYRSGRC
mmetsp:Transcript_105956/g.269143  ORF Transcript_105956/g.269143 Transcript_105956/m.269143 type:complete len:292 (+) Transcript_105956:302-1177(+)